MTSGSAIDGWVPRMQDALRGTLPGTLGVEVLHIGEGEARGRLRIERRHLHPGGFVHSAAMVCLADSAAAWATLTVLEEGQGFSTVEYKSNFFSPVVEGTTLIAESRVLHRGRRTIVLEAQVVDQEGRFVSMMIVTQAVLDGVGSTLQREATDG